MTDVSIMTDPILCIGTTNSNNDCDKSNVAAMILQKRQQQHNLHSRTTTIRQGEETTMNSWNVSKIIQQSPIQRSSYESSSLLSSTDGKTTLYQFLQNQLQQIKQIESTILLQMTKVENNNRQKYSVPHFLEPLSALHKYHSEQLEKIQKIQSQYNDTEQIDDEGNMEDILIAPSSTNDNQESLSFCPYNEEQNDNDVLYLRTITGGERRLDSVIETDNETDGTSSNSMISTSPYSTIGQTPSSVKNSIGSTRSSVRTSNMSSKTTEYKSQIHEICTPCISDDTTSNIDTIESVLVPIAINENDDDLPVTPPVTLNLSFATSRMLQLSIRKQQLADAKREWEETIHKTRFEDVDHVINTSMTMRDNNNNVINNSERPRRVYPTTPYQNKDTKLDNIDDEIDENEDDDDDSALYCATIVAKQSSSNNNNNNWKGTPLRNYVSSQLLTSEQKRSGRLSSFCILDVDVTESSSPTSTNITMDTISNTLNDVSLEKENDISASAVNVSNKGRKEITSVDTNIFQTEQHKIDEITPKAANSMLDFFRVEPDDSSPHGFRVVPYSYEISNSKKEYSNYGYGTVDSKTTTGSIHSNVAKSFSSKQNYSDDYDESSSVYTYSGSEISSTPSDSVSYRKPKTYRRTPYPKKSTIQLETMIESPFERDSFSNDTSVDVSESDSNNFIKKFDKLQISDLNQPRVNQTKILYPKKSTISSHEENIVGDSSREYEKENSIHGDYFTSRKYSIMDLRPIRSTPRKSLDNSFINTYQRRSVVKSGIVNMKTISKDEYKQMASVLSQQIPLSHLQTACDAFNYATRQQQRRGLSSNSNDDDTVGQFSILDTQQLLESFQFKDQMYQCLLLRGLHHFNRLDIIDTQETIKEKVCNRHVPILTNDDRRLSSLLQSALTIGGDRYMICIVSDNDEK
jgi:hypothetical protein